MAKLDENELERLSYMTDSEVEQLENTKKAQRQKKLEGFKWAAISVFVGLVLIIVAVASISFLLFKITEVEIVGNSKYTYDEIYEASGLGSVSNIIQVALNSSEFAQNVTEKYAYVRYAEVDITLPGKITVTITEDSAKWYGKIWNQWFVLSEDLRVIEKLEDPEDRYAYGDGLKWIKLPEVDIAIVGETVIFNKTTAYAYTTSFLNELSEQEIFESLEYIDVSDRYHISLYMNQHRVEMAIGDSDSLQAKISLIYQIMNGDEDITSTTIVSFNAEYVNPVIMLKGSEIFAYDE